MITFPIEHILQDKKLSLPAGCREFIVTFGPEWTMKNNFQADIMRCKVMFQTDFPKGEFKFSYLDSAQTAELYLRIY